jgi:peptidyl-prolyl cis-trans isomerase C
VLRDYLKRNPDIAVIPERRHIGQIVLKTRAEAEQVRKRIEAGESLFNLAGELSIDPYGRRRNGDMGWIKAGTGLPALEKAVAGLKDNEISEIVETPKGFHIVTIIERRPGGVRSFEGIKDRIRQVIFGEKLANYVNTLGDKYKVQWNVVKADDK